MSALSFYPTKNLPGIGDGGMVFCKNQDDADLIRKLRGHQAVRINGILRAGWNSRIDEIQSLAIRIRLSRFKDEQADRDRAANIYNNLIPESNRLPVPSKESGNRVTHHQYWVRVDNRDKLAQTLSDANVDFGVYYDPALHQDELSEYCRVAGKMTEAEAAGSQVIAIPIHQALADSDAQRIGELVRDHIENA
jgi:dTDP-4-amino-4,6-dideoxygalactose transaminase